jgi:hypothetical protein
MSESIQFVLFIGSMAAGSFGILWLCSRKCEHRYDLADLSKRDERGIVHCQCYKCGAVHFAEYGLALPGIFDRNSTADAGGLKR